MAKVQTITSGEKKATQKPAKKETGVQDSAMPSPAGWKAVLRYRSEIISGQCEIEDISGGMKLKKEELDSTPVKSATMREREHLALQLYELGERKKAVKADVEGATQGILEAIQNAPQGDLFQ